MPFLENPMILLLAAAGGGFFAALVTWLLLRQNEMRDLLSDMLTVQALNEAWIVEGPEPIVRETVLSDLEPNQRQLLIYNIGNELHRRKVEVRAILDEFKWSSPSKQCYDFLEYRRAWIIRNATGTDQVYQGETAAEYGPPALLSSRGFEELASWIERVASAHPPCRPLRMLSSRGLRMLRPLLLAISSPDRVDVFRGRLTPEAKSFLNWYYQREMGTKGSPRRKRLLYAWRSTPCSQLPSALIKAWKGRDAFGETE
jgi:hypothetical protein